MEYPINFSDIEVVATGTKNSLTELKVDGINRVMRTGYSRVQRE
jgi:hypothetical protein